MAELPAAYVPLRGGPDDDGARRAEQLLESIFAGAPADVWVAELGARALLVEPVAPMDRDRFRQGILDDPVNRQLGRVASYRTDDWGAFEQIGPLLRYGPEAGPGVPFMLPGIGEHSASVLAELGLGADQVHQLVEAGVVRQR
jgi:crotonobetainyl-CoA:carnitine CoA-transferase CaiB-like acyl-CoA transferase